jgi:hypothetical protein
MPRRAAFCLSTQIIENNTIQKKDDGGNKNVEKD